MRMERLALLACVTVALATGVLPAAAAQKPATPSVSAKQAPMFSEVAATWADIQAQVTDLAQLVKEKRLEEVHPVALEIRDLVRTLPDKSTALPAAHRKKLDAQVRIVDRLAAQLDKYGDAGNHPGTVRQQQALLKTLATIKSLYPARTLTVRVRGPVGSSKERDLYLTPGGIYMEADIRANGNQLPAQKFRGIKVSHDLKPKAGDRICPITLTKANPGYTWVVGGKEYQFCCPPCVEEFVTQAKTSPAGIKSPEEYVKQ